MNELTPKQKTFCQEYLVDLNATQAAIRAGYSKKTANVQSTQLLIKLNIRTYVEKLQAKRAEKTGVTQEYVIFNLRKVVEMSTRAVPVMVKEDGELVESGEYKFDSYGANKALELLGRHLAMFVDKHEHDHKGKIKVEHETMERYIEVKRQAEKELANDSSNRIKDLN